MDGLWGLLGLLGVAYLIAPIAMFFIALNNGTRLSELERRVNELARKIAQGAAPAPAVATPTPAPPPAPEPSPPPAPVPESPPPAAAELPLAEQPVVPPVPEPVPASVPPSPQSPPPAPLPPATAPAEPESFEQRFGTRWVVWIGGIALALGGIFLVNYAVEQGYFGPGVRITLASILAAFLIGAGEWARRTDRVSGFIGVSNAHVPSILTAAGTVVAFATAYAAFALYGFIGAAAA